MKVPALKLEQVVCECAHVTIMEGIQENGWPRVMDDQRRSVRNETIGNVPSTRHIDFVVMAESDNLHLYLPLKLAVA